MSPFVNLTNHPVAHWAAPQRAAAEAFGTPIVDVPFPIVSPTLAVEGLVELVDQTLRLIPDGTGIAMVAGEHTLTFALVAALQRQGIVCIAATSERRIELGPDGQKHVEFFFERFREYPGNPMRLPAPLEAVTAPPQQDAKPETPETETHETEAPRAPVDDLRRTGGSFKRDPAGGSRSGRAEPGCDTSGVGRSDAAERRNRTGGGARSTPSSTRPASLLQESGPGSLNSPGQTRRS